MYVYATLNNNGCQISTLPLLLFHFQSDEVLSQRQNLDTRSRTSACSPYSWGFKCSFTRRAEETLGFVRTSRVRGGRSHQPGAVGEAVAVQAAVSRTEPGGGHVMLVRVLVSGEKASLQQLDYFVICKGLGRDVQAQHLRNHHPEIRQLQRREGGRQGEELCRAEGSVQFRFESQWLFWTWTLWRCYNYLKYYRFMSSKQRSVSSNVPTVLDLAI